MIKKITALLLCALMLASMTACQTAEEKILRFGTSSLDGVFNPILSDGIYDGYVVDLIFDGMVKNNEQGEFVPNLATWTVSDDKLTYTFTLKDAKFSNGETVTAEDVRFTYEWMGSPLYIGARGDAVADLVGYAEYSTGQADSISGINVIDEKTIAFTVAEPNVTKISDFGYGIMNKKYYESDSLEKLQELNQKPMGAGAFVLEEYQPGQFAKLKVNKSYWNKDAMPKVDGVTVLIISNDTQVDALIKGEVDIINPTANLDNKNKIEASGVAYVNEFVGNGYNYIGLNLQDPVLAEKEVRHALLYGLDRKSFIDAQWQGFAYPCLSPISPVSWAYPDESSLNSYEYDPAKANQMLDDAGWVRGADGIREKDGVRFKLSALIYNDVEWPVNLSSVLKEQWGELGAEVELEMTDFNTVSDRVFTQRDFTMWTMGWSLSIDPDPYAIFSIDSSAEGGFNAGYYTNERGEELIAAGRQEYDQEVRKGIYQEWAQIANDDLPYLYMAVRTEIWGVSNRVKGVDRMGPYFNWVACALEDITIEDAAAK